MDKLSHSEYFLVVGFIHQKKHRDLKLIPADQPRFVYSAQTDTDSLHPTAQSDPDSQTARPQARNTSRSFIRATACCLFLNIFFYISVLLLCTFN